MFKTVSGLAIAALAMSLSGCSGSGRDLEDEVSVRATAEGLEFVAAEESWWKCEAELNGGWTADGFAIEASSVVIPWSRFTESDGRRFNPLTHAPESLSLSCETLDGDYGFGYYGW